MPKPNPGNPRDWWNRIQQKMVRQYQEQRRNFLSVLASYMLPALADRTPSVLAGTYGTFVAIIVMPAAFLAAYVTKWLPIGILPEKLQMVIVAGPPLLPLFLAVFCVISATVLLTWYWVTKNKTRTQAGDN